MYDFLYSLDVGKDFLTMTWNSEAIKNKIDTFDYVKKKTFEQQKIMIRDITNRETICTYTFLKNMKIS